MQKATHRNTETPIAARVGRAGGREDRAFVRLVNVTRAPVGRMGRKGVIKI